MKTEFKDYFFSTIAIFLIITISASLIVLLKSVLFSFGVAISPLIYIILFFPLYGLLTTLYLKVLCQIIPFKEGSYDMNHSQFTLWKHHSTVGELGKASLRPFFPIFMRPRYYALWGARIGENVAIAGVITDPLLIRIDAHAILGQDSVVTSHAMTYNTFFLQPVVIGKGATVGINAVIMPGVELGEYSVVTPGAVVPMNTKIPPNELWGGVPAKKIKEHKE